MAIRIYRWYRLSELSKKIRKVLRTTSKNPSICPFECIVSLLTCDLKFAQFSIFADLFEQKYCIHYVYYTQKLLLSVILKHFLNCATLMQLSKTNWRIKNPYTIKIQICSFEKQTKVKVLDSWLWPCWLQRICSFGLFYLVYHFFIET